MDTHTNTHTQHTHKHTHTQHTHKHTHTHTHTNVYLIKVTDCYSYTVSSHREIVQCGFTSLGGGGDDLVNKG